jgi:hypothetical protein
MNRPNLSILHGDDVRAENFPPLSPEQAGNALKKFAVSMCPFTPVKFEGEDFPWAVLRLGIYGGLAYLSWNKTKKLRYAFAAAAGVSALTSTMSMVWRKNNVGTGNFPPVQ